MKGAENDTTAHNLERSQLTQLSTQLLSGILKSRRARGTREETMASTPGQNVHLVLPHNHVVVSSSHLANSSSQLVLSPTDGPWGRNECVTNEPQRTSAGRLVVLSSHLVVSSFLTYCLVVPLLVYSSTRRITSCRLSTLRATMSFTVLGKRGDLGDLGTTTE